MLCNIKHMFDVEKRNAGRPAATPSSKKLR